MPRLLVVTLALCLTACPPPKKPPPPPPPERCEVDLEAVGLFSRVGSGAKATVIDSTAQLIGGEAAQGQVGDYLLENAQVRIVIQAPKRTIGPTPFGGAIIDADLARPAGEAGRDQLGRLGLLYQFGHTPAVHRVEVLHDGSMGGFAAIAATGDDALDDWLDVRRAIELQMPGAKLAIDSEAPLPLLVTTYYVLSPGESRVRMLTAFCNTGHDNLTLAAGELVERGGSTELFNPTGCSNGLGLSADCWLEGYPWLGLQGDGVAYGLRSYQVRDPRSPEASSTLLSSSGVIATVAGAKDPAGFLQWLSTAATERQGAFGVVAGESRSYLRDLMLGRDLADLSSQLLVLDNLGKGRLSVDVKLPDGTPAAGARVAVILSSDGKQKTLMVTGADGKAKADLPVGNYTLKVGARGHAPVAHVDVMLPVTGLQRDLTLGATRRLRVTVKDPFGAGVPAKVTVRCPGGACLAPSTAWRPFHEVDPLPSDVQALGFAGAGGVADVQVPPGSYEVLVSRGPEYTGWPATFPATGQPVDLTAADLTLDALIARAVDTTGWLAADLHVHAVSSVTSSVPNRARVLSAAAEGLDVLASTDGDAVTDYGPVIAELQLQTVLQALPGYEAATPTHGHYAVFPVAPGTAPIDWAGGVDGGALRTDQLYAAARASSPGALIQLQQPRGPNGMLTRFEVDTRTGSSRAEAATFRMAAHPEATATDTKLMSEGFDAFAVQSGATPSLTLMNDWMTFLSRGRVKAATAGSGTQVLNANTVGYGRTWVRLDTFAPTAFADALKARKAVAGNGPFVQLTARKLDPGGAPTGPIAAVGDTLGVSAAAGDRVELTVDVQAPEWMPFDHIELYTHAPGREAAAGQENPDWPASRVHQSRPLTAAQLTIETTMQNGVAVRRLRATERFTVTPSADTWYVAFVRGTAATRALFPLVFDGVRCNASGACTTDPVYAWSFTNPVLVDADGSGQYDDFPLK